MKTVALPIENKVREFDGKLWLGLNLVERGHQVILGPSWEIKPTIDITEPDLYFSKDTGDNSEKFFKQLKNSGILVCGLSPESNINDEIKYYAEHKENIINTIDAYFAWGEEPVEALRSVYNNSNAKEKIKNTGNPRFDLLTRDLKSIYADSKTEIHEEYGDFILINTNFGLANALNMEKRIELIRKNYPQRNPLEEARMSLRVLYSFLELILYLSAEDIGRNIVLRPHPGEDHSTYEQIFDQYETVHVKHEGDVRSWIYAADGVIHHNCTTGIEAAIMQTPVLSYQPLSDVSTGQSLPQIASQIKTSREDVKKWITDVAASEQEYTLTEQQKSEIRRYFPNIDQLAAPHICKTADTLLAEAEGFTRYDVSPREKLERRLKASPIGTDIENLYDYARDTLTDGSHRKSRAKQRQKFSSLEYDEVADRSERITEVAGLPDVEIDAVPQTRYTYRIRRCE